MVNQIWHCPYLRLFYYPILWCAKWYDTLTTAFESPKPVPRTNLMPGSSFFNLGQHPCCLYRGQECPHMIIITHSMGLNHHLLWLWKLPWSICSYDHQDRLVRSMSFKAPHPEASPSPCEGSPSLSPSASALSDKWLDANWGAVPRNLKLWSGIASSSQIIMIMIIIIIIDHWSSSASLLIIDNHPHFFWLSKPSACLFSQARRICLIILKTRKLAPNNV